MNPMTCLLIGMKCHHWNCYCVLLTELSIVETTEILIMIDAVCHVSKSLTHLAMLFCRYPFGIAHHLVKSSSVLISGWVFFILRLIG
jgi:hypothetical protein